MSFAPQLGVLPEAQRILWPQLKAVSDRFVLYGGTALALRCGHRISEDFDLFSDAPISPDGLLEAIPFLKGATVREKKPNTLTVTVNNPSPVKVSFFGLTLRRVADPDWTEDGVLRVASMLDIAGCKLAVVTRRSEKKDYLDLHALLNSGISMEQGLGAATTIYGGDFNPLISLKALTYFADGDLETLPEVVKKDLRRAAVVGEIARLEARSGGIVPRSE